MSYVICCESVFMTMMMQKKKNNHAARFTFFRFCCEHFVVNVFASPKGI